MGNSPEHRLPFRRHKPEDRTKFIVYTLWMSGFSAGMIGKMIATRPKVVLGIAQKCPWGKTRAAMTLAERQEALDELRMIRVDETGEALDGFLLRDEAFVARPLGGRQTLTGQSDNGVGEENEPTPNQSA